VRPSLPQPGLAPWTAFASTCENGLQPIHRTRKVTFHGHELPAHRTARATPTMRAIGEAEQHRYRMYRGVRERSEAFLNGFGPGVSEPGLVINRYSLQYVKPQKLMGK